MYPALDHTTLRQIYAQAEREFPRECCGTLALSTQGQWICTPCTNQQDRLHQLDPQLYPRDATRAYHIGGGELLRLARSFEGPEPVCIIYHSHPSGGAYFSETDRKGALASGYPVDYLVVDVAQGEAREARLFRQEGEQFDEIAHYAGWIAQDNGSRRDHPGGPPKP